MNYEFLHSMTVGNIRRIMETCLYVHDVVCLVVDDLTGSTEKALFSELNRQLRNYFSDKDIQIKDDDVLFDNGSILHYVTFRNLEDYISSHMSDNISIVCSHSFISEDDIASVFDKVLPVPDFNSDELFAVLGV